MTDSEGGRYEGGGEGGRGSLSLHALEPSVLLEVSFLVREEEEEEDGGREGGRGTGKKEKEEEGGVFSPAFVASLPFPLGGGEGGGREGGKKGWQMGEREGGLERRMAEGAISLERWAEGREGGWEGGEAYVRRWEEKEEAEAADAGARVRVEVRATGEE